MICRSCGGRSAKRDRHCVYCGRRLRLVPTWAKLSALPVIAVLVTVSVLLAKCDSPVTLVHMRAVDPDNQRAIVVESQYLSSKAAPTIDGALAPEEWGPSTSAGNVEFYRVHGTATEVIGSGEVRVYLSNDNASLYIATALTTDRLEPGFLDKEHVSFWVELLFDGDNNGLLGQGEDVRMINWDPRETGNAGMVFDYHASSGGLWGPSADIGDNHTEDGEAAACFVGEENAYSWELRIPLSSGDPDDLAVAAGDTIGVQLYVFESILENGHKSTYPQDAVVWPGLDWAAPNTYAKIVLAAGPG